MEKEDFIVSCVPGIDAEFQGYTFGFEIELRAFDFRIPPELSALPKKSQYILFEQSSEMKEESEGKKYTGSLLFDAGTVEFVSQVFPEDSRDGHYETLKTIMNGIQALQAHLFQLVIQKTSIKRQKNSPEAKITVRDIQNILNNHNIVTDLGLLKEDTVLTVSLKNDLWTSKIDKFIEKNFYINPYDKTWLESSIKGIKDLKPKVAITDEQVNELPFLIQFSVGVPFAYVWEYAQTVCSKIKETTDNRAYVKHFQRICKFINDQTKGGVLTNEHLSTIFLTLYQLSTVLFFDELKETGHPKDYWKSWFYLMPRNAITSYTSEEFSFDWIKACFYDYEDIFAKIPEKWKQLQDKEENFHPILKNVSNIFYLLEKSFEQKSDISIGSHLTPNGLYPNYLTEETELSSFLLNPSVQKSRGSLLEEISNCHRHLVKQNSGSWDWEDRPTINKNGRDRLLEETEKNHLNYGQRDLLSPIAWLALPFLEGIADGADPFMDTGVCTWPKMDQYVFELRPYYFTQKSNSEFVYPYTNQMLFSKTAPDFFRLFMP